MFISKTKLLMAVLVVALIVPAAAYATDAWSDVDNGKFYHDAVTWAQGNGMTTGCNGGTGFCPDRVVTRGENITFAKRYDDLNQVWLADIQADADAAQADADTNATNIGTNTAAAAAAQADADTNAADISDNTSDISFAPVMLWAVINSDGTVARSSDGVTSTSTQIGRYEVVFNRNITNCSMTATPGLSGSTGSENAHMTSVVGLFEESAGIYLKTYDPAGDPANAGVHIIVVCPWNEPFIIIPFGGEATIDHATNEAAG